MDIKKMIKRTAAAVLAAACALGTAGCKNASGGSAAAKNEMREMTTMELVRDMGLGINLGNTMECSGTRFATVTEYETFWGSPVITQTMIQGYKDCGFGVLRIPVAWSNMMKKDGTYTINADYMARVKQIVDWAMESDLYVILNIHWDGGWFEGFAKDDKRDGCFEKYERIWQQITEVFNNDYGDKLMFESMNEEGEWGAVIWNRYSNEGDKEKNFNILNEINQKFVDTVRASGGNNEKRHLLVPGYQTDVDLTCDPLFKMPNDPQNRCAVSVHYYTPSTFAILEADADWGKARTEWGTDADYEELNANMDKIKTNFIDKGIPVILGEYSACGKNKTPEMKQLWNTSVCRAAYERGICPVLWDITQDYYDREAADFREEFQPMLKELMEIKNSDK